MVGVLRAAVRGATRKWWGGRCSSHAKCLQYRASGPGAPALRLLEAAAPFCGSSFSSSSSSSSPLSPSSSASSASCVLHQRELATAQSSVHGQGSGRSFSSNGGWSGTGRSTQPRHMLHTLHTVYGDSLTTCTDTDTGVATVSDRAQAHHVLVVFVLILLPDLRGLHCFILALCFAQALRFCLLCQGGECGVGAGCKARACSARQVCNCAPFTRCSAFALVDASPSVPIAVAKILSLPLASCRFFLEGYLSDRAALCLLSK